jgi:BMFP domain-containing protein YqiC
MQGSNKVLDDISKVMTGAAGAAQGVREEVDGHIKNLMERLLRDMDLVTRDEFEAVKEMARIARDENDTLSARIEALERIADGGAEGV